MNAQPKPEAAHGPVSALTGLLGMAEYLKPHYLLLVQIDNVYANVYINTSIGRWVARQKDKGSRVVVVNAFTISTADYLYLKRA